MKFDLHCHSNASDGSLSPEDVIQRVEAESLDLFALTDHDTLAGYDQIKHTPISVQLISGVEFSTQWSGVGVHVVGLDFDPEHSIMKEAIQHQRGVREKRAHIIDERLAKKGMPNSLQGALKYCPDIGQVGRPHFAAFLLEKGYVKSKDQAFDRWLGNGKIGDVKSDWPTLEQAVQWINQAGGVSVIAHPLRYKLTMTKLKRLIVAFKEAGGCAIEVVGQQSNPEQKKQLVKFVLEQGLAGSGGSDFHEPDWQWAQIGKIDPIPSDITPVWTCFKRTQMKEA